MPNIRRGFPPGVAPAASRLVAAANAGVMVSSIGKERKMPAARRNFRREKAWGAETKGPRTLEKRAFMMSNQQVFFGDGKSKRLHELHRYIVTMASHWKPPVTF
jgi:hypothetical protein